MIYMDSVKLLCGLIAAVVMIAVVMPVSADSYFGYSQSGSQFTGSQVSISSSIGSSFIGNSYKPALSSAFNLKGFGSKPSLGSTSTYLNFGNNTANQKFTYSETSSASGKIYQFSKIISVIL